MSAKTSDSDDGLNEINVTPLVDIMLVLLIIFMVAAPMIQQGVDVSLPKVVATELPADSDLLVVTVHRTGRVFLCRHIAAHDAVDRARERLCLRRG